MFAEPGVVPDLEVSCKFQVKMCSFSVPWMLHHASKINTSNRWAVALLLPLPTPVRTPDTWKRAGTGGSYASVELFYKI